MPTRNARRHAVWRIAAWSLLAAAAPACVKYQPPKGGEVVWRTEFREWAADTLVEGGGDAFEDDTEELTPTDWLGHQMETGWKGDGLGPTAREVINRVRAALKAQPLPFKDKSSGVPQWPEQGRACAEMTRSITCSEYSTRLLPKPTFPSASQNDPTCRVADRVHICAEVHHVLGNHEVFLVSFGGRWASVQGQNGRKRTRYPADDKDMANLLGELKYVLDGVRKPGSN